MEGERYRTRQEMIEYFRNLAYAFSVEANVQAKKGNIRSSAYALGKSDAYENAAFELEHNMEG